MAQICDGCSEEIENGPEGTFQIGYPDHNTSTEYIFCEDCTEEIAQNYGL